MSMMLTRELVEKFLGVEQDGSVSILPDGKTALLNTDAHLREQIEALKNENALMAAHQGLDNYQYMNDTIISQRDQLQAQSVCYQDNLTEIQLLKAQVVSREKEVDRMMAQRNLAEAKLLVLERREQGYLSELDDYARTVLNLRSRVKACEKAKKLIPRAPTETETVCGACGGCGWVERGY